MAAAPIALEGGESQRISERSVRKLIRHADLPDALGRQLAIALIRQVDTSDLVGRVIGLHDEGAIPVLTPSDHADPISDAAATLSTVRTIQTTLQGMLPPPRQLQNTPLQLELLGVTSTLYLFVVRSASLGVSTDT